MYRDCILKLTFYSVDLIEICATCISRKIYAFIPVMRIVNAVMAQKR